MYCSKAEVIICKPEEEEEVTHRMYDGDMSEYTRYEVGVGECAEVQGNIVQVVTATVPDEETWSWYEQMKQEAAKP